MKTMATTTSPAIAFSANGTGLRRRLARGGGGGGGGFGACFAAGGFAAGTSALIGRFLATAGTLHAEHWLAGQISFQRLAD